MKTFCYWVILIMILPLVIIGLIAQISLTGLKAGTLLARKVERWLS